MGNPAESSKASSSEDTQAKRLVTWLNNGRYDYVGHGINELRSGGLEIDKEIDNELRRIIESEIYNSILKSHQLLVERNSDSRSVIDALSSLKHLPVQSASLLASLEVKDAQFLSELNLLCGYFYEIDNNYVEALSHYDSSGNSGKAKELMTRIMGSSEYDFEKEKMDFYPNVFLIVEKESEKKADRRKMGDAEVEKMREERRVQAKDLESKLGIFLQKFTEKKDIDKEAALEIIRQKLKLLNSTPSS